MAQCTEGVFSIFQVDPDLVYSMALSGVHHSPIFVVINKYPFASDMPAYNVCLHAVNGILVRAFVRSEGVCVWGAVTTSILVIATAPMSAATVLSAASIRRSSDLASSIESPSIEDARSEERRVVALY